MQIFGDVFWKFCYLNFIFLSKGWDGTFDTQTEIAHSWNSPLISATPPAYNTPK
jgi:hypothetical protein